MAVAFIVQSCYYLVRYSRIPVYRQKTKKKGMPPVSVVVIINDNMAYLDEVIPELMAQDYKFFEVVVVDAGSRVEVVDRLAGLSMTYRNMKVTRLNPDPKYKYRRKLALNVGIKACTYPNIIFTEPDAHPSSSRWLSLMAKGFTTADVVIGYCGIEPDRGLANRFIRCDRMMMSVRYLASAIKRRPYRGIAQNMGYTGKVYFSNNGFSNLDLSTGDDDLFIQQIAGGSNTAVIINPRATMRQYHYGGLGAWFGERKFFSYTYRYYPAGVKFCTAAEFVSRYVFFGTAAALIAMQSELLWMVAAGLVLLRWMFVLRTVSRICRRLGERGLMAMFLWYDIISPLYEAGLSISRRLNPGDGLWDY